ncbi:MAG: hypothetical protein AAFQ79_01565 [Pseudomonadota bacterium]
MSGDVSVDFRTAQALADLQAAARAAPPDVVTALANGSPVAGAEGVLTRLIADSGCDLSGPGGQALYPALKLAATLPENGLDSFLLATIILVANGLKNGGDGDDLFWHWDAFRSRYREAEPPVRAAIYQGFRRLDELGQIDLFDKPQPQELCRYETGAVIADLTRSTDPDASALLAALAEDGSVAAATEVWERRGSRLVAERADAMLTGMRHVFESSASFAPAAKRGDAITVIPFDTH